VALVRALATAGTGVMHSDTEVSFVERHSGLDTTRVPGDVGFICMCASSSCFSGNSVAKCHVSADAWCQKSPWPCLYSL